MQAQVIKKFGDTNVFETMELPKPQVKSGYVLVKVMATSVNPIDTKLRAGKNPAITADFPAVLHGDVAGVIEALGADIAEFKVGDEVFGCAGGVKGSDGALAEYMLVDARLIAKKPKSLTMIEAAALPLVSITAWEALFEKLKINSGEKILIHAGTGGVGHVAIQLAKWAGAKVYTTISSAEKAELVKKLGASEIINYREETVEDYVKRLTDGKGFELVLDTVGGENLDKSFAAASLYGRIAAIQASSTHNLAVLHTKSASLHIVLMLIPLIHNIQRERHKEILNQVAKLAEQGVLRPLVDKRIFSFEEISKAHTLLESGKALGKIVVAR